MEDLENEVAGLNKRLDNFNEEVADFDQEWAAAALSQPFAAAGAFHFEKAFSAYMPLCLGCAAGVMGVFLIVDVLPMAARASSYPQALLIATVSGVLLLCYLHVLRGMDIEVHS